MKKIFFLSIFFCALQNHGQQLDNNNFENWENVGTSSEEPIDWSSTKTSDNPSLNGFAPQVLYRTSDSHSGTYAAKLVNKNVTLVNVVANGLLTNGRVHSSTNPDNAYVFTDINDNDWNQEFSHNPDSLTGWYKYSPQSNDIGEITVLIHSGATEIPTSNTSNWIAIAEKRFTSSVNSWTRFSVPFYYFNTIYNPEYILCVASAGDSTLAIANSELKLDDLQLIYNATTDELIWESNMRIVNNNNYIQVLNLNAKPSEYSIYNITGKLIMTNRISNDNYQISIEDLITGIYVLRINNDGNFANFKFFK